MVAVPPSPTDRAARWRLRAAPWAPPASGLCHGDLHPGNVRFDAAGKPTLFDFDCCGYGWRVYDLAVFHWNIYMERRPTRWRERRWEAFLRGYERVRALPGGLHECLPFFLVARQIWLLGLDAAGKSGYPPQWVHTGMLKQLIGFIHAWDEEYGISASTVR